jgi:hypothetical protein
LDQRSGRMLNANLEEYKISGSCDMPQIDVVVLEDYRATSATDAYGIAEPSNIATAPAIGNAVYNAIGVRIRSLPMTPAAVLAVLGQQRIGHHQQLRAVEQIEKIHCLGVAHAPPDLLRMLLQTTLGITMTHG